VPAQGLQLSVDVKAWEESLARYVRYTHHTCEEALFRKAKDLLFRLSKKLPPATIPRGSVGGRLEVFFRGDKVAACKFVALREKAEQGFTVHTVEAKKYHGVPRRQMRVLNSAKTRALYYSGDTPWARYYTRAIARQYARKNANARKSHLGFTYIWTHTAIKAVEEAAARMGVKLGLGKLGPRFRKEGAEKAVVLQRDASGRVRFQVSALYRYRRAKTLAGRPIDRTAEHYEQLMLRLLPECLREAIADTEAYLSRKMGSGRHATVKTVTGFSRKT